MEGNAFTYSPSHTYSIVCACAETSHTTQLESNDNMKQVSTSKVIGSFHSKSCGEYKPSSPLVWMKLADQFYHTRA